MIAILAKKYHLAKLTGRQYSLYENKDLKVLFVIQLSYYLMNKCSKQQLLCAMKYISGSYPYPGYPVFDVHTIGAKIGATFSFAFVRHPFERLISAYRMFYKIMNKRTKRGESGLIRRDS